MPTAKIILKGPAADAKAMQAAVKTAVKSLITTSTGIGVTP